VYANVPFASENAIVLVIDAWVVSLRVTDHEVPGGSPASANVTTYVTAVKEMATFRGAPFTGTDPEEGEAM